ncbi:MAG: lytic transglycosylase domain-containing protein, partial [Alphaproteobacteria bacterium]|nr:lytic transglycosylase domain-containing protein [Alphaproteobacteria bacterium]
APDDDLAFTEAEWTAGWMALRFLGNPVQAYRHFQAVYDAGHTPITKSRGAYWAGRAAEANHEEIGADSWYLRAAAYPAAYYGQLAAVRLGLNGLQLPPAESRAPYSAVIAKHSLVPAVRLLASAGNAGQGFLDPFFLRMADLCKTEEEFAFAAALAHDSGRAEFGLRVAKRASRKGFLLMRYAFPTDSYPTVGNGVGEPERALLLALARQESEFDQNAISPAGALGLMQLMPATATEVARKLGISFKQADLLSDPRLNARLGTTYLAGLLESYDNFYPLALAAYNAGPGRARQWMRENGDPRHAAVDPVDWIEQIPFPETRNYVQRVLESLNVYRYRLDAKEARIVVPDRFTR